jgi:hypothetical protein
MKKAILFVLMLAVAAGAQPPAPKLVTPKKTIRLFNGKNLDNFYTYLRDNKYQDPKKVFTVSKGVLRISGEEWGAVTTRDAFRDYHLIVEWKWGGKNWPPRERAARDSGIMVHSVGADGAYGGVWMASVECQIIEGGCGDIILVGTKDDHPSLTVETRVGPNKELYWQKGGQPVTKDRGRFDWFGRDPNWKDVLGFRGGAELEKPLGEWNRSEVICKGDSITTIVNGVIACHGTKSSLTEGRIQIQSEAGEILVRRVELRPL